MTSLYDEMVNASAIKISGNVAEDLLDMLYEDIQSGKIEFNTFCLKKAIAEVLGEYMTLESLGLKFDGIYTALQKRLAMVDN